MEIYGFSTAARVITWDEKGLDQAHLSQNKIEVLYASNLANHQKKNITKTEDIENHDFVSDMMQPAFYGCLKNLVNASFLAQPSNTKASPYVLATQGKYRFLEALSA